MKFLRLARFLLTEVQDIQVFSPLIGESFIALISNDHLCDRVYWEIDEHFNY